MQVTVTVPNEVFGPLQKMAEAQHVSVEETLARIAQQAVFSTASNVPQPANDNGGSEKPWRSLLDLRGVGVQLWKDSGNAQEWVNKMREDRDPLVP